MTLLELINLLKKHLKLVIFLPIFCALAVAVASVLVMSNKYTATTSMYILNRPDDSSSNVYSDLSASQMLANDVATLLKSDSVMEGAAKKLDLKSLSGYSIDVTSETTSRVITLAVTAADPDGAATVANALAAEVSSVAQDVQMADGINVIDKAHAPSSPSGPNRPMYVAVAFLGGLFLAVALVVLADMLNTRVRSGEEVEEMLGIPVIGRVPSVKMKGGR